MDIKKYGTIIHYDSQNQVTLVQITDLTLAKIKSVDNGYDVQILKKGIVLLNYKDRWVNENKFTRQIGENIFTFSREGIMDLFTVFKPTRYIKRVKTNKKINKKVLVLDMETYLDANTSLQIPYLISYYDGEAYNSFYLTDYNSPSHMIKACISSLLQTKYNKHKVYIHNLANFDGIFLLKNLVSLGDVKVIMNKGSVRY